ncbi:Hypothetical predicted protein [Cloeon dipterum]|uniref:Uncharacterized protein n=1 Tax=Cloeon dipterum TaxID=197152 RepID=A0A8S1D9X1_9INSE|nr:Hypothetical predicted protein [Cloeon dipterum]
MWLQFRPIFYTASRNVCVMNPCFFAIVLLHLSLATAVNFTRVFEWPHGMDYEWPSEANRINALNDWNIELIFMAVYGTRIFLSLDIFSNVIPVTLVSLPTSIVSSASPKMTPFPSWDMHEKGGCNKIGLARGLQVDSVGRLWVLDKGSDNCNPKLWIFNLSKNDHTELIHRFSFHFFANDFVLDETPNDTFAYIERWNQLNIVVFSLERNQSWIVETPGIEVFSTALFPKEEPRQLYLSRWHPCELYSVSVTALLPYRMLIDNEGTFYAAYLNKNYIHSWNSSQPFEEEHRFYEGVKLDSILPFTFALDSSGTFWMTELYESTTKPRYRLLKAAIGAKSYIFETSSERSSLSIPSTTKSSTPSEETAATVVQNISIPTESSNENRIFIITLICSNVFTVILSSLIIFWLILKLKRNHLQNTTEGREMSVLRDNYDDEGPAEAQYEEVQYEEVTQPRPFHLAPTSSRFVSARDLSQSDECEAKEPSKFEKSGTRPSVEFDDVGPAQPEHLYQELEPTSTLSAIYSCSFAQFLFNQQNRNVLVMNPCFFVIILLHLSSATAANFTQVFVWPDGMDYEWPSEESRTNALKDGTFKPEKISPIFLAVFGTRIFLSLEKYNDVIPVTLVSLPTSSASSAPPKLTPFPSWDMHARLGSIDNCENIEKARGLEVDSVGRLWVLDSGSENCNATLWIFDLSNNDQTKLTIRYQFTFRYNVHDLVLEETPNGTLAYIAYWGEKNIVVFSLEGNESWIVETPGKRVYSIALSPRSKEEPRKLYLGEWDSDELYSISVTALRKGTQTAYPELIGRWSGKPYRMLMDNHGTMYAAFWGKNYISSWNTYQSFLEQRFHELVYLGEFEPFTFALDSSGTFWMTELTVTKPTYRLLKATVGAESYNFEASSVAPARPTTTTISPKTEPTPVSFDIPTPTKSLTPDEEKATSEVKEISILADNLRQCRLFNIILICSFVFTFILMSPIILWLVLGWKRISSTPQNTTENQEMSVFFENNDEVGSAEVQFEKINSATPLSPSPTHSTRDLSQSGASEAGDVQEIWRVASCSVENDVNPAQPEHLQQFRNVWVMNPCFFVIALLHFSLAFAANFTQVFEWPDGMDYEWPSEESRTNALKDETFNPEKIEPLFMAVHGTRIFLSLNKVDDIPVTLVSLPTSSVASPKLTPFPSWDMHEKGNCSEKIEEAKGLEVDSVGRLWVLDSGSKSCNTKLWFIHLSKLDRTELIHEFQYLRYTHMNDLVLDETPKGSLAYISSRRERHIVVFSLETKESWLVGTSGIEVSSIALSPKEEARQLYLSKWDSFELFSISVTALRKGTRTAYPELIGKWNRNSYRMLMDNDGTMYAAFWGSTQIFSLNTSQPFQEQRFYEIGNLETYVPFTFALDSSGFFWMTELCKTATKQRYRLLMTEVGAKSYIFEASSERSSLSIPSTTKSSTPAEEKVEAKVQESCIPIENSNENRIIITTLICSIVLLSLIILWLTLGPKMINLFTPQNTNEAMQMPVLFDCNEEQFEAVTYENETRSPSRLLRLVPTSRRFVSVCNLSESDSSETEDVLDIWKGASCSSRV